MSRREEILTDDVHVVRGYIKRLLPTVNGLIAPKDLDMAKKEFLAFSTTHLADELLTVVQDYPTNEEVAVTLSSDMIVMDRKAFAELIEIPINPVGESSVCGCGKLVTKIQHN